MLDEMGMNQSREQAQIAISVVLTVRLAYAIINREQSNTWKYYIVALFLSVPIYVMLITPSIETLDQWLYGR